MLAVSVIIATRNRADALEMISLPSLAKQDFKDFEVIIWDASNDDKSKIVVEKYIQSHPDMVIRYFKAPRVGSASQRNDAVKVANGDIIFFIDDDSELSTDAIKVVVKTLDNTEYSGCEVPVQGLKEKLKRSKLSFYTYAIASLIFRLGGGSNRRYFRLSGYATHENSFMKKIFKPKWEDPEWLVGCSMAYKKEVFREHKFDEELQRFGGYALGEDSDFSYSLHVSGYKLCLCKEGYVIHHHYESGRAKPAYMYAMVIYNYHLIWKKYIYPRNKLSIFPRIWAVFGYLIVFLFKSIFSWDVNPIKGWYLGVKSIFLYKHDKNT